MELHETRDTLSVRRAILTNARYEDAKVSNSVFQGVNLSSSSVSDANKFSVSLASLSLSDCRLHDVKFSNDAVEGAILFGMTIDGAKAIDLLAAYEPAKG